MLIMTIGSAQVQSQMTVMDMKRKVMFKRQDLGNRREVERELRVRTRP